MARHALLIGVSDFNDKRLAALNAPSRDVEALGTVLRDPNRGGFTTVTISLDEDYLVVRDRLSALFDSRDQTDMLLLFYSGHGILGRGNRLFLATPMSDLDRPRARSVSATELRDHMDQSRADQQAIILDCCHSGAFAEGTKGSVVTAITEDTFEAKASGRYILTAADTLQFAWDGDRLREGESADRGLSQFTSWLVDGLERGEAAPYDENVTMDALFRYVCRRARADNWPTTPKRYVDRATGDLVIARNPDAPIFIYAEFLSDLLNLMIERAKELAQRLTDRTGEVADFLLLQLLNRWQKLLMHRVDTGTSNQESLYSELVQMAGELATFAEASRLAATYPAFQRENVRQSFALVVADLQRFLAVVKNASVVQIPLEDRGSGICIGISHLFGSAQSGITLRPLAVVPRYLPSYTGASYFELDKESPLWPRLQTSGGFGIHSEGGLSDLNIELWAIRE